MAKNFLEHSYTPYSAFYTHSVPFEVCSWPGIEPSCRPVYVGCYGHHNVSLNQQSDFAVQHWNENPTGPAREVTRGPEAFGRDDFTVESCARQSRQNFFFWPWFLAGCNVKREINMAGPDFQHRFAH